MAKIPVTDNDFRLLTVWDVQEINTTIYSAELRSDFDEQSVYYGVLDSILKKSALLTDPDIIPLISQFIGYGDRIGNVPQQYTTLINFTNTNFEEQQENEEGDDELGRTTDNPTVNYGEFYYVIADPLQKTQIKLTKKLPPPVNTNFWYFFKSLEDINLYYKKYPLEYTDTTFNPPVVVRAFKVAVAKCSITLDYVNRVPPYDDGDIPIYSVNDIYNYYITVGDVIDYTLFAPFIANSRTKRVKRGRR